MTVEQALEKVRVELSDIISPALISHSDLLQRLDVDEDEVERLLIQYRAELMAWRARTLAEIEGLLRRDGEALH